MSDTTPLTEEERGEVVELIDALLHARSGGHTEAMRDHGFAADAEAIVRMLTRTGFLYSERERVQEESRQALRTTLAVALERERVLGRALAEIIAEEAHGKGVVSKVESIARAALEKADV